MAFMDSTGLACLLEAAQAFRERGADLAVLNPSEPVRRLPEVSGAEKVLPVYRSTEQAPR